MFPLLGRTFYFLGQNAVLCYAVLLASGDRFMLWRSMLCLYSCPNTSYAQGLKIKALEKCCVRYMSTLFPILSSIFGIVTHSESFWFDWL
jgi:hypothetical protein